MDWVLGAVIITAIIAVASIVFGVMEHIRKRPVKINESEELTFLKGKALALEEHIKWMDNHVERHDTCRKKAEENWTALNNKYLCLIDKINAGSQPAEKK
jgi:hypothetical protein